jgi:hypothetical protein
MELRLFMDFFLVFTVLANLVMTSQISETLDLDKTVAVLRLRIYSSAS